MRRVGRAEAVYRADFHRKVLGMMIGQCFFKNLIPHDCEGPADPMHFIPKQNLRRLAKERDMSQQETWEMVWDARNGAPGCRKMHDRMDNRAITIPQNKLPRQAIDFAYDYGVVWMLDDRYPKEPSE